MRLSMRWTFTAVAVLLTYLFAIAGFAPERVNSAVYVNDVRHADSADVAVHALLADSAIAAPGGALGEGDVTTTEILDGTIASADVASALHTQLRNARPDTLRFDLMRPTPSARFTGVSTTGWYSNAGGWEFTNGAVESAAGSFVFPPGITLAGRTVFRVHMAYTDTALGAAGRSMDVEFKARGRALGDVWNVAADATGTDRDTLEHTSGAKDLTRTHVFNDKTLANYALSSSSIGFHYTLTRYGDGAADDSPGHLIVEGLWCEIY
jgi:hypothetical protein